jgi:hypothetical protein
MATLGSDTPNGGRRVAADAITTRVADIGRNGSGADDPASKTNRRVPGISFPKRDDVVNRIFAASPLPYPASRRSIPPRAIGWYPPPHSAKTCFASAFVFSPACSAPYNGLRYFMRPTSPRNFAVRAKVGS